MNQKLLIESLMHSKLLVLSEFPTTGLGTLKANSISMQFWDYYIDISSVLGDKSKSTLDRFNQ